MLVGPFLAIHVVTETLEKKHKKGVCSGELYSLIHDHSYTISFSETSNKGHSTQYNYTENLLTFNLTKDTFCGPK